MVRDWLTIGLRTDQMYGLNFAPGARKAALSAVFILSAPYTMMSYSILAFIIGIAIYQGFTWTHNLDIAAGDINSRNVFIAFLVCTGFGQSFFLIAAIMKDIEGWIDFGTVRVKRRADRRQERSKALQMDEHPAADTERNTPKPLPTDAGPQQQGVNANNAVLNLAAMLEAAARAHEASAEADRRVASEYRALYTAGHF